MIVKLAFLALLDLIKAQVLFDSIDGEFLRPDRINEGLDAPGLDPNLIPVDYGRPYDFKWLRNDDLNAFSPSASDLGQFQLRNLVPRLNSEDYKLSEEISWDMPEKFQLPTNLSSDSLFFDGEPIMAWGPSNLASSDGLVAHVFRSRELPLLNRGQLNFQHICGSTQPQVPGTCSIQITMVNLMEESRLIFEVPHSHLGNDHGVGNMSKWQFESVDLPPILEPFWRVQIVVRYNASQDTFGLTKIEITTPRICQPEWERVSGFEFNVEFVEDLKPVLFNFDGADIAEEDLDQKYYLSTITGITWLNCARLCWLGSACEMLAYNPTNQKCQFTPHLALKSQSWANFTKINNDSNWSIYILQCSKSREKILPPRNLKVSSDYHPLGPSVPSTKIQTDISSSTRDVEWISTQICNESQVISLKTQISKWNLPHGMNYQYLSLVKPHGLVQFQYRFQGQNNPRPGINHSIAFKSYSGQVFRQYVEESADFGTFTHWIPNLADILDVHLELKIEVGAGDSKVEFSPYDVIMDIPIHIGCFKIPASEMQVQYAEDANYFACATKCLQSSLTAKFIAMGDELKCVCLSDLPKQSMELVNNAQCNSVCGGTNSSFCGGPFDRFSVFVNECPKGLKRLGDYCFELSAIASSVTENFDACSSKDSHLWYPRSIEELLFVSFTFPNNDIHLGFVSVNQTRITTSDYKMFGGVLKLTHDNNGNIFPNLELTLGDLEKECLIFRSTSKTIERISPCPLAKGICQSSLVPQFDKLLGFGTKQPEVLNKNGYVLLSRSETNRAMFELQLNAFHNQNGFVEIVLPIKIVLTGMVLVQDGNKHIKSFQMEYTPHDFLDSDAFVPFASNQVFYAMQSVGTSSRFNSTIRFPQSVITRRLRIKPQTMDEPLSTIWIGFIGNKLKANSTTDLAHPAKIIKRFRQEELKSMHSKTYLGDDFCSNSGGSAHVHLRVDDLRDVGTIILTTIENKAIELDLITVGSKMSFNLRGSYFNGPLPSLDPSELDHLTHSKTTVSIFCNSSTMEFYVFGQRIGNFVWNNGSTHQLNRLDIKQEGITLTEVTVQFDKYALKRDFPNPTNNPVLDKIGNEVTITDEQRLIQFYSKEGNFGHMFLEPAQVCFPKSKYGPIACLITDLLQSSLIGGGFGAMTVSKRCPKEFRYLSDNCYFPSIELLPKVPFFEANTACLEQDQMLFHFTNQNQALVLPHLVATLYPNVSNVNIWLGIVRDSGSNWVSKRTMTPIPHHQSNWAPNEPSETGGNCAVADQALNFQWRSTSCSESHSHLCSPSEPPCPRGYEWVKSYGRSCFKLVERDFQNGQGYRFGNIQILEDQCRQDGTRLAKAINSGQTQALVDWLNTKEPWLSENSMAQVYLGMKWRGSNDTLLSKEFVHVRFLSHFKAFKNDTGLPGNCFVLTSNTTNGTLTHQRCNYQNTRNRFLGLCQYEECITEDKQLCIFPFKYQGRQYDTCVTLGASEKPWCSTQVDTNGVHIDGQVGNCSTSCSVNNCPIGFMRGFPDHACYKTSSHLPEDFVESFEEAQDQCAELGARLWELRTVGVQYQINWMDSHLYWQHFVFKENTLTDYMMTGLVLKDLDGYLYPHHASDGTPMDPFMFEKVKLSAELTDSAKTCLAYKGISLEPIPCSGFYNGIDTSKNYLGFICEARDLETYAEEEIQTCHLPFRYKGIRYLGCVLPGILPDINSGHLPWCATTINETNQEMLTWGRCYDERNLIPVGNYHSIGEFCAFPFIRNRRFYTTCTRKIKENGDLVRDYSCPTKKILEEDGITFLEGSHASCNIFSSPKPSKCPDHYDLIHNICVRISPYPETLDNATTMCESEGSSLLTIKSQIVQDTLLKVIEDYQAQYKYFANATSFWIGAEFLEDWGMWKWKYDREPLHRFSQWWNNEEGFGCNGTCSQKHGLTLSTLKNGSWEAQVDRSLALPYICQFQCKEGYEWYLAPKRCLKVFPNDQFSAKSLPEAMFNCSKNNARLASIRHCDQLEDLRAGLSQMGLPNNDIYYLGAFANIQDPSGKRRNVDQVHIDSLGYPVYETLLDDSGLCQSAQNRLVTIGEDPFVLGLILRPSLKTHHELITNQEDRPKQGFICEIDRDWTCPYQFFMIQDTCLKPMNVQRTYGRAMSYCSDLGYQLARPSNIIQVEFLRQMIKEQASNDSYWIGFSFAEDGAEDQFGFFVNGTMSDCLAMTKNSNGVVQFQLEPCDGTRKVICQTDQGSTSAQSGKIPVPIGLFPLEKMNGTRNVLDTQLVILNSENVGFHSRQILPLKFIGNARFTSNVNSYLSLDVLGREKVFQKSEITVLVWVDLHGKLNQEFVLMDARLSETSGLLVAIRDGHLFLEVTINDEKIIVRSPDEYGITEPNQLTLVGFTFNGQIGTGTFFLGDRFGYRLDNSNHPGDYFNLTSQVANTPLAFPLVFGTSKTFGTPNSTGSSSTLEGKANSFHGGLSCLQIFNSTLRPAEIAFYAQCPGAERLQSQRCSKGYSHFQEICFKISWNQLSAQQAEINCIAEGSRLLWNTDQDILKRVLKDNSNQSFWLALHLDESNGKWVLGNGTEIPMDHPQWAPGQPGGVMGLENCVQVKTGGWLHSSKCETNSHFVCTRPLLSESLVKQEPSDCPKGFQNYRGTCLMSVNDKLTYDEAQLVCAAQGSHIYAPKSLSDNGFIRVFANLMLSRNVWIGIRKDVPVSYIDNDPSLRHPLRVRESVSPAQFSDGSQYGVADFDFQEDLMVTPWKKDCLYWKDSLDFAVRDANCDEEYAFICEWKGSSSICPPSFVHLGKSMDGVSCLAQLPEFTAYSNDTCQSVGSESVPSVPTSSEMVEAVLSRFNVSRSWINAGSGNFPEDLRFHHSPPLVPSQDQDLGCLQLLDNGVIISANCSEKVSPICQVKACLTTTGLPCLFPFKYRNISWDGEETEIEYWECSSLDLHVPWCATGLEADGRISTWGYCLSDCPSEKPEKACLEGPMFPDLPDDSDDEDLNAVNYTTQFDPNEDIVLKDFDFVSFDCPEGFVFENSNNISHRAWCYDWKFRHDFDLRAKCKPIQCPCPPWFPPNTWAGTFDWGFQQPPICPSDLAFESRPLDYLTQITYKCPEGFVFETPWLPSVTGHSNETGYENDTLVLTCGKNGAWDPPIQPKCIPVNCTQDPFIVKNNDQGKFSWNLEIRNKSFTHNIKYWCPLNGWGYPSSKNTSITNTCRANKEWSITFVEPCQVLPCPEKAPAAPQGGWKWETSETSKYKCPNGYIFSSGQEFSYSNCTAIRKWYPKKVEDCVPRHCSTSDPAVPFSGMEMDWPHRSSELNTTINYTCPPHTLTWKLNQTVQTVSCIWDNNTDLMKWYPSDIDPCNLFLPCFHGDIHDVFQIWDGDLTS